MFLFGSFSVVVVVGVDVDAVVLAVPPVVEDLLSDWFDPFLEFFLCPDFIGFKLSFFLAAGIGVESEGYLTERIA